MGQISEEEINQIIAEIKAGATNYSLGKKYNHSANTIQSIRERVFPNETTDREQIPNSNSQQNQQSYPTNEFTPQIIEKAEELVNEEDALREKAKEILKKEKREKIIDEYFNSTIRPKFVSGEWLTKEDHENLKQYYETEIKNLKQDHEIEIKNLKQNHKIKINNISFNRYNEGFKAGNVIYCKHCGIPISIEIAEQHGIPCPRCFKQQQQIQQQIQMQQEDDTFLNQLTFQSIFNRR